MAVDPDLLPPPDTGGPADIGKADEQEVGDEYGTDTVDIKYWISCLDDAERAEADWRKRGREIVQIYRNETKNARTGKNDPGPVTFNILYANTEVTLPSIYAKPPQPVVRSRFTKVSTPMQAVPPMPMPGMGPPGMPPGAGLPPGLPPGMGASPPMGPPGMAPPIAPPGGPPMMGGAGLSPQPSPPMPPPGLPPQGLPGGGMPPDPMAMGGLPPPPPQPPFGMAPGQPSPPMPTLPQPAPGRPAQKDIETAASIMEKTLEIVVDDEHSNDAIKMAIRDVLLPGRGTCRVRWKPQVKTVPVEDPVMGGQLMNPGTGEPQEEEKKVWESVDDEYVYWEDFLCDPVRHASDTGWVAFRHLFTRQAVEQEFADSPEIQRLQAEGKLGELLRWTDESAAKSPVGGGTAMKTAGSLGDHVRKLMVWEIWDKYERRVIWFCRDMGGLVLRVDPDSYQLQGFFPCPVPMLAVTTTDSRIPRPFYDLYSRLAADLDETSKRISDLTKRVRVTGAYNGASREMKDLLTAGDGKMIPIDGVDVISGGLQNHIWMLPIDPIVQALAQLYLARDQIKQSIYEIMGISDIMRGATKATETATAQRIKGSMGVSRLEDQKSAAGNFTRDLLRLKAELIAQNFDGATLEAMTGEMVTPEVEAILRSDFQRTCSIDIEADSTVVVDEQVEQEAMAQIAQTMQMVMQGGQAMLMTGILPPPQVMQLTLEMLKMFLHPVRFSRGVVEMINDFQEQLTQQIAMQAMMPPAPMIPAPPSPPGGPPGASPAAKPGGNGGGPGGPPPKPNGGGLPPAPQGPNAGMPPPPMM